MGITLIKVDRNGTKYFVDTTCHKCGGSGYIQHYHYIEGGVCFNCGGSGYAETHWKEYTPEYQEKLTQRRLAKRRKQAAETNKKFCKEYGLAEDGSLYLVGGNTYEIKEQLKEAGCRWHNLIGWHFNHEVTEFPVLHITWDEMNEVIFEEETIEGKEVKHRLAFISEETGEMQFTGWYTDMLNWFNKRREEFNAQLEKASGKHESEHLFEVGQKIEADLRYIGSAQWTTHFHYYGETNYLHKFEDENGNVLTWKTSNPMGKFVESEWKMLNEGDLVHLKGTVKAHDEYKGTKQTALTRCRW